MRVLERKPKGSVTPRWPALSGAPDGLSHRLVNIGQAVIPMAYKGYRTCRILGMRLSAQQIARCISAPNDNRAARAAGSTLAPTNEPTQDRPIRQSGQTNRAR